MYPISQWRLDRLKRIQDAEKKISPFALKKKNCWSILVTSIKTAKPCPNTHNTNPKYSQARSTEYP